MIFFLIKKKSLSAKSVKIPNRKKIIPIAGKFLWLNVYGRGLHFVCLCVCVFCIHHSIHQFFVFCILSFVFFFFIFFSLRNTSGFQQQITTNFFTFFIFFCFLCNNWRQFCHITEKICFCCKCGWCKGCQLLQLTWSMRGLLGL